MGQTMAFKGLEIDAARWEEEVLRHPGPVAVDFYSTECAPCEALAGKFEPLSRLYGDDVRFVKIFRQGNRELAERLDVRSSPTVLFYQGGQRVGERLTGAVRRADLLRNLEALLPAARAAELRGRQERRETDCDVVVLGAGPAGLTAGIYLAQAKRRVIVVDRGMAGGYVSVTHQVSNYPGFPAPQPGFMLGHHLHEHAVAAGVEFRLAVDVTAVDLEARRVELDGLETLRARRLIVATGTTPRPLKVAGEREYGGQGISYCATCDAKNCEGKDVIVIGGGNSAIEEALFITSFARRVTIVHQFAELQANQLAQEQARANPRIEFVLQHEPRAFVKRPDGGMDVAVEDLRSGARRTLSCGQVFVFAGLQANLEPFGPTAFALDQWGYIKTDDEMRSSVPGVFAIGDIIAKKYRQITTAVADGTIAAIAITRELQAEAPPAA